MQQLDERTVRRIEGRAAQIRAVRAYRQALDAYDELPAAGTPHEILAHDAAVARIQSAGLALRATITRLRSESPSSDWLPGPLEAQEDLVLPAPEGRFWRGVLAAGIATTVLACLCGVIGMPAPWDWIAAIVGTVVGGSGLTWAAITSA